VVNRLSTWLTIHVWKHQLGEVFSAPVDVRLSRHNIVQPDILSISRERSGIARRQYVDGTPNLVVEVLSERTQGIDLVQKRSLYAIAGVPEYWIANLEARTLTVFTLVDGQYEVAAAEAGVARSLVVPGFEGVMADVFARPLGEDCGGPSAPFGRSGANNWQRKGWPAAIA
jgi:Uma2 family endonuclease